MNDRFLLYSSSTLTATYVHTLCLRNHAVVACGLALIAFYLHRRFLEQIFFTQMEIAGLVFYLFALTALALVTLMLARARERMARNSVQQASLWPLCQVTENFERGYHIYRKSWNGGLRVNYGPCEDAKGNDGGAEGRNFESRLIYRKTEDPVFNNQSKAHIARSWLGISHIK